RFVLDARVERASPAPFTAPDRRQRLHARPRGHRYRAWRTASRTVDPRLGFKGHTVEVAWGALQVAYFIGCSLWTALTVPFLLTQPGFQIDEPEPWAEEGETWRRLRAVFLARIGTHHPDRVFYFGPDGLLRRHDTTWSWPATSALRTTP